MEKEYLKLSFFLLLLFVCSASAGQGFENRQYIYERDVLYAFPIPSFDGRGLRIILVVSYQPSDKWNFWFRIARTKYLDRSQLGSGLETIEGNKRTDIKFQVRFRF